MQIIIVEDSKQLQKILAIWPNLPKVKGSKERK